MDSGTVSVSYCFDFFQPAAVNDSVVKDLSSRTVAGAESAVGAVTSLAGLLGDAVSDPHADIANMAVIEMTMSQTFFLSMAFLRKRLYS